MSDTKWTPGPWVLETVKTSVGVCHKVGPFPAKREDDKPRHACLYADYPSDFNPADQALLANARLIAAAPDLYEALQACIDYGSMTGAEWVVEKARASLAKARGE